MSETKTKRIPWNKGIPRTEESKRKQKETLLKRYGVLNVSQVPFVREKIKQSHSSAEWKQLVKEVKQQKYGDPNYNNMEKNYQTKLERYGDQNFNNVEQMLSTKRENKTFNKSQIEEEVYQYLTDKYGADNIIRQYKEVRYPFSCDFYIKSTDTFIELNIHPCHNFKPYDKNSQECIDERKELEKKALQLNSDYYRNTLYVWIEYDTLKLRVATDNKLTYLVYYTREEVRQDMKTHKL